WNKLVRSPILQEIKKEWVALLDDKKGKEKDYHSFIQKHPALFLCGYESYLAISKLKLGSDYETDFVVVKDGYSGGTIYELIEIEIPHTSLFDNKGVPTSKFNSALQQVRDWKRWLMDNRGIFKNVLPTTSTRILRNSKIRFKIIIGRRTDNQEHIEKRSQIEELENIEIISFDRLTDVFEQRITFERMAWTQANVESFKRNELANPFHVCVTDSEWRKICRKGGSHVYSNLIEEILEVRTYNEYFEKFKSSLLLTQ
ncbi:MAG: DUF4263 domain-containing protein, partial [Desulfobulbaceae bacterium]|nr:DUF4263 domain-containing protein [Desulfobulbaceae bacterium]